MRRSALLPALIAVTCMAAAGARAEIYTWTDAKGRVHMTDDRSQVPPEHRKSARRPEVPVQKPAASKWNSLPAAQSVWQNANPSSGPPNANIEQEGRTHVLYVDRAGREMVVSATCDGTAGIPFVVDTGAMLNTIPAWAVRKMGIELTPDLPSTSLAGIGGRPMQVPLIRIARLEVGTAVVEDVEMAVLSTMNQGLLGMPFFNHFKVHTDPTSGRLTLEEIDLNGIEGVYGGLDEKAWRSKFRQIHGQLAHLLSMKEDIPSYFETASGPYVEQIEEREEYWRNQLDDLEERATRAGVPASWRYE
ncbi:MAG: aspartyl protease family protein [Deltaproteobacteria bacterium]|nr:aspartyl protease family protein [Deltaproteobacteria bacterium]MBW2414022.1 aspartyl protease family protein [Deltaproteobacteria bacterium]